MNWMSRVGPTSPVTVFPDDTLDEAINRMLARDLGRLPVVARGPERKIVGLPGPGGDPRGTDVGARRGAAARTRAVVAAQAGAVLNPPFPPKRWLILPP